MNFFPKINPPVQEILDHKDDFSITQADAFDFDFDHPNGFYFCIEDKVWTFFGKKEVHFPFELNWVEKAYIKDAFIPKIYQYLKDRESKAKERKQKKREKWIGRF